MMRSQLVGPVLAQLRAAGADVAGLVRRFGLEGAEAAPEVVLPLVELHAFLDAAAEAARDPFLGLHVAARLPRGAYGVLEFACRTAPTIRAALARIVRYIGLLNELVTVSFEEHEGVGVVEQRIPGEPRCVGRHGNELFVATVLMGARALSGQACVPERVWFAHDAPADTSELVQTMGTRQVRFGAGRNGIEWAAAVLDLPLATSDPPLLSILDKQAEQALAREPVRTLGGLVRRRVREGFEAAQAPSLASVATGLHMSARTLQRRLTEEGTSFVAVLDEVRQELAVKAVREGGRPLGEIAFLLGYAELSPFLRAFKRWTGTTPGELRARGG
jgi:AraC-like DNA-binding protein